MTPMSRLDEGRKRSELEKAVASLEAAIKALETSRTEEKQESATRFADIQKQLAEEQQECDDCENEIKKLNAENADLGSRLAASQADTRGMERLYGIAEKQIKQLQTEKTAIEKAFLTAISEMKGMAQVMCADKEVPSYSLKIVGRDGNNELSDIEIVPK